MNHNYFENSIITREPLARDIQNIPYSGKPFAVIGDTQKTLWYENLFLLREDNEFETTKLISHLSEENIAFISHLGDAVEDGSDAETWKRFDLQFKNIIKNNTPIYITPGNHDYWGDISLDRAHLSERFPEMKSKIFYSKYYGSLGMIWIDSNHDILGDKIWEKQIQWFKNTIMIMDQNPEIHGIIVFMHHTPYTNSEVTPDIEDIQTSIIPAFNDSKKGIILFSGHAHGLEHFYKKKKTYIVSGGGGGPRVLYLLGSLRRHYDSIKSEAPRAFHYLLVSQNKYGVNIKVMGFNKNDHFKQLDIFSVNYTE